MSSSLYHGESLRLATLPHRQNPDIPSCLRIRLVIDNESSVPRPISRKYGVIRFQQQRLLSGEAGRLLIEVPKPAALSRRPDDAASVRRPDRAEIRRWIKGEAHGVAHGYVTQPEVVGAGLGINLVGDKTLLVGGEPELANACGHIQRVD